MALCNAGCGDDGGGSGAGGGDDACALETSLSLDDSRAYFPFRPGNRWAYRGSRQLPGGTVVEYGSRLAALAVEQRDGISMQPLRTENPRNSQEAGTQYFVLDDTGILNHGNDDATDTITPELVPYPEATFPITLCSSFEQFDATVDSGRDLDSDGKTDLLHIVSRIWMRRLENVETPIGTFTESLRLERKTTATITGSRTGQAGTAEDASVEWFAKGIGPVKRTVANDQETVEEVLYGFGVDGSGRGADLLDPLAMGIAPSGSNQDSPGRPAVASDGTRFLVVYVNDVASTPSLEGLVLSNSGSIEQRFSLGESGRAPSATYDGQNYFVAFESAAGIDAVRLSPDGTKLGARVAVASNTSSNVREPDVAFGGDTLLVAYSRYNGTDWDVIATRVSTAAAVLGEVLPSAAPRNQGRPAVSFDGMEFLVAWDDARNDASFGQNTDIYAARVASDGTVLDSNGIAVATGAAPESDVDVTYDGSQFVLAWYASRNPSFIGDGDIRGARLGSDGVLLDGDPAAGGMAINTTERSKGHPRVARFGTGTLVVWDSQDFSTNAPGILGARLDQSGTVLDGGATAEGIWLSPIPSPSMATRLVSPELAEIDDRILLAYIDNVETAGQTKSLGATMIHPW